MKKLFDRMFGASQQKEVSMNQTIFMNTSSLSLSGSCEKQISSAISEELIREKAYYLWEAAGKPDSDGSQFWLEAERQLQNS